MKYVWLHVESGATGKCEFNAFHHPLFAEVGLLSSKETYAMALGIVNKWNRESRGNYVYWIE